MTRQTGSNQNPTIIGMPVFFFSPAATPTTTTQEYDYYTRQPPSSFCLTGSRLGIHVSFLPSHFTFPSHSLSPCSFIITAALPRHTTIFTIIIDTFFSIHWSFIGQPFLLFPVLFFPLFFHHTPLSSLPPTFLIILTDIPTDHFILLPLTHTQITSSH